MYVSAGDDWDLGEGGRTPEVTLCLLAQMILFILLLDLFVVLHFQYIFVHEIKWSQKYYCAVCSDWKVKSSLSTPRRHTAGERYVYLFIWGLFSYVGRDSVVCVATSYGLHGPGIESLCGRDFPHSSRQALGPIQPPAQWVPGFFPGGQAARTWHWPPIPIQRRG
jgi:hypothetical protein